MIMNLTTLTTVQTNECQTMSHGMIQTVRNIRVLGTPFTMLAQSTVQILHLVLMLQTLLAVFAEVAIPILILWISVRGQMSPIRQQLSQSQHHASRLQMLLDLIRRLHAPMIAGAVSITQEPKSSLASVTNFALSKVTAVMM